MPTKTEIRDGQLQALQSRDDEINRLRELCCDAYAIIDVLANGVGKIATPDGFFALWNQTSIQLERLGAKPFKVRASSDNQTERS